MTAGQTTRLELTENVDHRAIRGLLVEAIRDQKDEMVMNLLNNLPLPGDRIHVVSLPNHTCLIKLSGDISNDLMQNWLRSLDNGKIDLCPTYEKAARINFIIAAAARGKSPAELIH